MSSSQLRWLHKLTCLHGIFSCQFHNIPTLESLFQNQKWPASPLLFRQWRQSFLILNVTYLFHFWPCSVFVAAQVFLFHLVVKGGSCCSLTASHRGGFYCCRAQAPGHAGFRSCRPGLQSAGSVVVTHRLIALHHVGSS